MIWMLYNSYWKALNKHKWGMDMKIYGVLIILLTFTMACVSKPKLKTFKFEKDRQLLK